MSDLQMSPKVRELNAQFVTRDPAIMDGVPVFKGTQVPITTLVDYLLTGRTLRHFLEDHPAITREQAIGILEIGRRLFLAEEELGQNMWKTEIRPKTEPASV